MSIAGMLIIIAVRCMYSRKFLTRVWMRRTIDLSLRKREKHCIALLLFHLTNHFYCMIWTPSSGSPFEHSSRHQFVLVIHTTLLNSRKATSEKVRTCTSVYQFHICADFLSLCSNDMTLEWSRGCEIVWCDIWTIVSKYRMNKREVFNFWLKQVLMRSLTCGRELKDRRSDES